MLVATAQKSRRREHNEPERAEPPHGQVDHLKTQWGTDKISPQATSACVSLSIESTDMLINCQFSPCIQFIKTSTDNRYP